MVSFNITKDVIDPFGADGPMANIRDQLVYGIMNVKRSRYLMGSEFRKLQTKEGAAQLSDAARKKLTKEAKQRMKDMKLESERAVDMVMDIAKKTENKELADALIEVFSSSNKIQNWEDLHGWMSSKLLGGNLDGKKEDWYACQGASRCLVNSTLSGPKTPVRAILGTTVAVLDPLPRLWEAWQRSMVIRLVWVWLV